MNKSEIIKVAIEFANRNKKIISRSFTDIKRYSADPEPASVFMAGSPGAGKTEYSKSLIAIFEDVRKREIIRIDPDEFRKEFPGYIGSNSNLFQAAVSILVSKVHDTVLQQRQSFILDGTFSSEEIAIQNIERSLSKSRYVFIFYIYQLPEIAWQFTQARELKEGRSISKDIFIQQFIKAREVVNNINIKFGTKVSIFIVKKNFKDNTVENVEKINESQSIDDFVEKIYTKEELYKILH